MSAFSRYCMALFACMCCAHCSNLILYSIHNDYAQEYAAQHFAVRQINSDNRLLSNYNIEIKQLDSANSNIIALKHAMDLISATMSSLVVNDSSIIIPIVIGCPWSSMTIMTAPALNAFNFGMISSSSTSIRLSDTESFKYFYRTVADDSMQAKAIIQLLTHKDLNWNQILIMHDNDAYGMSLAIELLELCTKNDITANSISYQRADIISMQTAAASIKHLKVHIVVLIIHGVDLYEVISTLKNNSMWGYPWFYIGADAWLNPSDIAQENATTFTTGLIGTVPWQPGSMSRDDYDDDLLNIYNTSLFYDSLISDLWTEEYINNPSFVNSVSSPGSWAAYQWDCVYVIARALERFDEIYSLQSIFNGSMTAEIVLNALNDIIINEIHFVSVTGNVTFDEKGNRKYGLYSYGNLLYDGGIQYFGYYINEFVYKIDTDSIIWPSDFVEKGIIPRSMLQTTYKLITIDRVLLYSVCVAIFVSTLIVVFFIFNTIRFRTEQVIKAGSWKLNLIVCFGCLLAYIAIILDGSYSVHTDTLQIDDLAALNDDYNVSMTITCNARIWLLCVAFTLIFMPLFMKTYRLVLIFRSFEKTEYKDSFFIGGIIICVAIDILLLSIFTVIEPLKRQYKTGSILDDGDELQQMQYIFGACIYLHSNDSMFYLILGLWKAAELIFGIYVALVVSHIGLKKLMSKFDETAQQIFAIIFTAFIMTIIVPYLSASANSDQVNFRYAMISICILIVCNVSLIVNILPRIHALYYAKIKNDDRKLRRFEETFEETVLKMIKTQIHKLPVSPRSTLCSRCRQSSDNLI